MCQRALRRRCTAPGVSHTFLKYCVSLVKVHFPPHLCSSVCGRNNMRAATNDYLNCQLLCLCIKIFPLLSQGSKETRKNSHLRGWNKIIFPILSLKNDSN